MRRMIALMVILSVALITGGCGGSGSGNGLYVVAGGGGKARLVASGCIGSFSWSPDGNSIAFMRWVPKRENRLTWIVDLRSGRTRMLAKGGAEPPSWSPDGAWIAYPTMFSNIFVVPAKGQHKRRLIAAEGIWPAWSPDGKRIAFNNIGGFTPTSPIDSAVGRVAIISPDGSGLKYLTVRRGLVNDTEFVSWFPDGRHLLFVNATGDAFMSVKTDRSGLREIGAPPPGEVVRTHSAALSPNGKVIAFDVPSERGRIYLLDTETAKTRFLTTGDVGGWSPDSKQLVLTEGPLDDVKASVYVINSNGTGRKRIASHASVWTVPAGPVASWSSRNEIAYIDEPYECRVPARP